MDGQTGTSTVGFPMKPYNYLGNRSTIISSFPDKILPSATTLHTLRALHVYAYSTEPRLQLSTGFPSRYNWPTIIYGNQ